MCPAKFWMQDSEKFVPQGCKRKKNDKNRIRKKKHNNFKILFSTKPHFRHFSQQSSIVGILHRKFTKFKNPQYFEDFNCGTFF